MAFNYALDSLVGRTLEMFRLVDITHTKILITWHPFLGVMHVENPSEGRYVFEGAGKYPKDGIWDEKFIKHTTIRYVIEFHEKAYWVYRDRTVGLKLEFDKKRIAQLKSFLFSSDLSCIQDWSVSEACSDSIEMYEYQLFAASLSGERKYVKDFINLRSEIPFVNAGSFSQYLEGNYQLLAIYGLVDADAYDENVLSFMLEDEVVPQYYSMYNRK